MQFEIYHKIGTDYSTVKFNSNNFKYLVTESFETSFERIGGIFNGDENYWTFPSFVTSQIIQEIIHNTCFVCGGLMKDDAIAYQNTLVSFNDFGNDAGQIGTTQSRCGKAALKVVRKCSSCGHSHT